MKKIFTLAAAALMTATMAITAQAQVVVNGVVDAAEVEGNFYQLLGAFTHRTSAFNPPNRDLRLARLFAGNTAERFNLAAVGAVEANNNAYVIFFQIPRLDSIPAGTVLPFDTVGVLNETRATLAKPVTHAVVVQAGTANATVTLFDYTSGTTTAPTRTVLSDSVPITGTTVNVTPAGFANGISMAFNNPVDATWTAENAAAIGGRGLEISFSMVDLGLQAGDSIPMFAGMSSGGGYFSGSSIPQTTDTIPGDGHLTATFDTRTGFANGGFVAYVIGTATSARLANKIEGTSVFPNPFSTSAQINYTLTKTEKVSVKVYDLLGREVAVLADGMQNAGANSVNFSINDVQRGGYYLVRVQAGDSAKTHRVSVVK
jgi:hypothetical protein